MENGKHVSEEALERYALGRIFGLEASRVEGHLLVCSECQDRLQALNEYLTAMRAALAKASHNLATLKRSAAGASG